MSRPGARTEARAGPPGFTLGLALCLACAFSAFGSAGAADDDTRDAGGPPPGIVTSQASLKTVLRGWLAQSGTLDAGVAMVDVKWAYKRGDLGGTLEELVAGDDYRSDITLGTLHEADGSYRGATWNQDYNGYTIVESGVHASASAGRDALAAAATIKPPSNVVLLGESPGHNAYVVAYVPPRRSATYYFFDKTTFGLVRSEHTIDGIRRTVDYDDFRPLAGRTVAWHERESDGRPFNDEERTLRSFSTAPTFDDAPLRIPADARAPLTLAQPAIKLPARIVEDRIIVTVLIGGRKVNLQLDSGASGILLDRSVVDALKLPTFGKSTEATAGTYTAAMARIPTLDAGGATLHDVIVETAPFVNWQDAKTPIAGLLGFDFIAGCVLKVDYAAGTVEALAPDGFAPPANASSIPIVLDDRVPMLAANIGGVSGEHFILDTGADRSMLFADFVAAHPKETTDQGLGAAMTTSSPFVSHLSGVGGEIQARPVQIESLGLGTIAFPRWLFLATTGETRTFEGDDIDGLIGQDVLRNFVLYLDYRRAKVYLVPNERFKQRYSSAVTRRGRAAFTSAFRGAQPG
jgi:hypothetical protein